MRKMKWAEFGWRDDCQRSKNGVYNRCVECNDTISNPVCPDCLAKQIKVVLEEIAPQLSNKVIRGDIEGETRCLSCGNKMGLCAHCYCMDVYQQLAEKDEEVAEEFLSRFDFDLRIALI